MKVRDVCGTLREKVKVDASEPKENAAQLRRAAIVEQKWGLSTGLTTRMNSRSP